MKNILLIFFLAAFTSCYTVKPCQCPEPKIIEVVRYPENDFLIDPGFSHPRYIPYDSIKLWIIDSTLIINDTDKWLKF
jgi:hypothetical protein